MSSHKCCQLLSAGIVYLVPILRTVILFYNSGILFHTCLYKNLLCLTLIDLIASVVCTTRRASKNILRKGKTQHICLTFLGGGDFKLKWVGSVTGREQQSPHNMIEIEDRKIGPYITT